MGLLLPEQRRFVDQVAAKTGLSRRVIAAWALAEQSGGAAKSYRARGYNNWLNIGAFDSGFGDIYHDPTWRSPEKAAAATADFLKGRRFGASGGIRKILSTAGADPGAQISAIARSGWATSGYEGGAALRTLYGQLGWMKDSKVGAVVNGGGRATTSAAPGTTASSAGGDGLAALTAVLAARQKPVLQSAGVQAPAFSARPAMPQGYQQASSGGAPQKEQPKTIGEILAAAGYGSAGTDTPVTATAAEAGASGGSTAGAAQRGGTVRVSGGANRAGVGMTPGILKVLRSVAAETGPLTVGTGTNHSQMTTSGNVSEHWSGNAADIPASGEKLTRMGRRALIAAGMDPRKAAKAKGGIYDLPYGKHRRIQIIFNTTDGGNHFDHLHVGVTPKR